MQPQIWFAHYRGVCDPENLAEGVRAAIDTIENVQVQPETGISVNIQFEPTGNGSEAQVVLDFSMTSEEIMPAVQTMFLDHDWDQGYLYNQETAEQPQLYFDHMAKQGDAYQLAREIRDGLDQLDVQ